MPPLPKRKYAKARQGDRRSHLALTQPQLSPCPRCKTPKPSHVVCPECGTYDGRDVLQKNR
jgi:large subunit ribosomal protein L32